MGLRQEIQNDLIEAFNEDLSDCVTTGVLTSHDKTTTVYNPTTGISSTTSTDYGIRGIIYEYTEEEKRNIVVEPKDCKFLVNTIEFLHLIKIKDDLLLNSKSYKVKNIETDPSGSIIILHLSGV